MRYSSNKAITIFLLGLAVPSCQQKEVNGIWIGETLYENQSFVKQQELRQLIRQTLNKDEKALAKLCGFWCGGGAGCYDLGFVVTQIIYSIGEKDFIAMASTLDKEQSATLESLIMAGLEYGDQNKDGKADGKTVETEFPALFERLKSKINE